MTLDHLKHDDRMLANLRSSLYSQLGIAATSGAAKTSNGYLLKAFAKEKEQ